MSAHRGGVSINIDDHIEEHAEVKEIVFPKLTWLSRMIEDMREDPDARTAQLKEHLAGVQERSQMQQLIHALPIGDTEGEASKKCRNTNYQREKMLIETGLVPKIGSMKWMLQQYEAE